MPDMLVLVAYLSQCVEPTPLRQRGRVIEAMLSMSGRVTMRGLSRWSGTGGSSRTIQRLCNTSLHWCQLNWLLIRHHVLDADDVVVMRGDHVVVTKSGKMTSGVERVFSSLYGKTVPGLCFLRLSLLSVKRRTSSPVITAQGEKPSEALGQAAPKTKARGRRGRPQGSKHRHRRAVALSPSLRFIQKHIQRLLARIGEACKVVSCLCEGELGHNEARHMVSQGGLHLISKLRDDSALYFPSDGPYGGRGPRRKDGQKVDSRHLPSASLQATAIEQEIQTQMYQLSLWHKQFAEMLPVVVIVNTNLYTHKTARVVLFSRDLTLGYAHLIDSDRLRFQLECNFR